MISADSGIAPASGALAAHDAPEWCSRWAGIGAHDAPEYALRRESTYEGRKQKWLALRHDYRRDRLVVHSVSGRSEILLVLCLIDFD